MSWLDSFAVITNTSYLRSYVDTGETGTGSQFLESLDDPEQVLQYLRASREQFHFIAIPWAFIPQKAEFTVFSSASTANNSLAKTLGHFSCIG